MSFHNDSIFWIEVDKIKPNPYQPRREFDQTKLQDLADSIRQYGVLQPLVVTRQEVFPDEGGMVVEYELIAGERRLRAARIAGVLQVPVVVRDNEEDERVKLEIAIIENLQREDLNPIDRARAFERLASEFGYKHSEIAKKIGRSREYVSNTIRVLAMPDEMMEALAAGKITEGHTRPILMLADRPDEQRTLFKEILSRRLKVRDAERISRRIAYERARKASRMVSPTILDLEEKVGQLLGARVHIEQGEEGGKILIDYFSDDDLQKILMILNSGTITSDDIMKGNAGVESSERMEESEDFASESDGDEDVYSPQDFTI